jgi:hypothetical protein
MDELGEAPRMNEIRSDLFNEAAKNNFANLLCKYDELADTFIVRLAPYDKGEEFVHFVDDFLAIIVRVSDMQIIAVMVENYNKGYKKQLNEVSTKEKNLHTIGCLSNLEISHVKKQVKRELQLA